jgi:putative aldouronate transport system permease protein
MHNRLINSGPASRIFDFLNVVFMLLFSFIMIYPFYNQLILSLNDGMDAARGGLYFFPRAFTLVNYNYVFNNTNLGRATIFSILRVTVGSSSCLFATGYLSYIVTIQWFSGRRFIRVLFLITMYFGGGLIPFYLLIVRLGLLNTFSVYWIPSLISAYYMLLMASYMQNLPESLAESARLDGANELTIYLRIIFPVSVPVFAAIAVFSAVGHWNAWFDVMIFNPDGRLDTLQVILRKILLQVELIAKLQLEQQVAEHFRTLTPNSIRAATAMIVTLPIVFSYPFLQKYFISGITLGSVKG